MKKLLFNIILALAILLPVSSFAQGKSKTTSLDDRQRWISELRNYKHDFLAKELSLSKGEQEKFFPVYDEMDDELTRIASETRDLEQKVLTDDNASETELNAATQAVFQQKKREGEIEELYYDKLKEVLTPRKLLRLKNAERKFTQQLLRRHGNIRAAGKKYNK